MPRYVGRPKFDEQTTLRRQEHYLGWN